MGIFNGTLHAKTLEMRTHVGLIVPDDGRIERVLLALHGLGGASDSWLSTARLEQYAKQYHMLVVTPEVQRGFYMDMKAGYPYFTYVAQEIPAWVHQAFHVPLDRAHFFVAGNSMGGFGAMKCALTYPELFGGAMVLSARYYFENKLSADPEHRAFWQAALGEELLVGAENDLEALSQRAAQAGVLPRLYVACGTEDFLYEENVRFARHLEALRFPLCYEEGPGAHNWDFWTPCVPRALAFMFQ